MLSVLVFFFVILIENTHIYLSFLYKLSTLKFDQNRYLEQCSVTDCCHENRWLVALVNSLTVLLMLTILLIVH